MAPICGHSAFGRRALCRCAVRSSSLRALAALAVAHARLRCLAEKGTAVSACLLRAQTRHAPHDAGEYARAAPVAAGGADGAA